MSSHPPTASSVTVDPIVFTPSDLASLTPLHAIYPPEVMTKEVHLRYQEAAGVWERAAMDSYAALVAQEDLEAKQGQMSMDKREL
ncbi:hypothetical protein JCM11641_008407 [Rhodosporidiobolus odoratus]